MIDKQRDDWAKLAIIMIRKPSRPFVKGRRICMSIKNGDRVEKREYEVFLARVELDSTLRGIHFSC